MLPRRGACQGDGSADLGPRGNDGVFVHSDALLDRRFEVARKRDRERQKKAEAYVRKLAKQGDKERAKQRREYEKYRREEAEAIDEIFHVYDVRLLRRERVEGHDTIVCSLTPRPGVRARTRDGKIMQKFVATAWVSEQDRELVRVEVEATDTVSIGMGLLARVHKGTRASFQRRKVNGEEAPGPNDTPSPRRCRRRWLRRGGDRGWVPGTQVLAVMCSAR